MIEVKEKFWTACIVPLDHFWTSASFACCVPRCSGGENCVRGSYLSAHFLNPDIKTQMTRIPEKFNFSNLICMASEALSLPPLHRHRIRKLPIVRHATYIDCVDVDLLLNPCLLLLVWMPLLQLLTFSISIKYNNLTEAFKTCIITINIPVLSGLPLGVTDVNIWAVFVSFHYH